MATLPVERFTPHRSTEPSFLRTAMVCLTLKMSMSSGYSCPVLALNSSANLWFIRGRSAFCLRDAYKAKPPMRTMATPMMTKAISRGISMFPNEITPHRIQKTKKSNLHETSSTLYFRISGNVIVKVFESFATRSLLIGDGQSLLPTSLSEKAARTLCGAQRPVPDGASSARSRPVSRYSPGHTESSPAILSPKLFDLPVSPVL